MAHSIHLKNKHALNLFVVVAFLFMVFWVDSVSAQTAILDNIGQVYKTETGKWGGKLSSIAQSLFIKLALLEFVWFGVMFVLEKDDPRQFMIALLKKVVAILFFFAILKNFNTWIPAIVNGFSEAGQSATGLPTLTPSEVMERGLNLSTAILEKAKNLGFTEVGPFFLAVLVAIMILLAFVVISGQMLVTLIESYIVIGAGILFLGFAGSRWTTTFAEKFISYAVSVGVKLFVIYLIIGAGQGLSASWLGIIQSSPEASGYLEVLAGAIIYMFLAFQIPSLASSMLTGTVSMTLGGAAATAGAVAGAGLGAAGVVGALGASAAGGATALSKTVGAAIGASKAGGASGILGVGAGAIGALGSATAGAVSDGIKGLGGAGETSGLAGRLNSTAASLNELKASSGVSAPSVPGAGQQTPAPSAPSAPQNQAPTPQPAQATPESKLEQPNTAASNSAATSSTGAAGSTAQPGQASAGTPGSPAGSESSPTSNIGESATTPASTPEPSADVVETSAPAPVESVSSGESLPAQGEQVSAPAAEASPVPSSTAAETSAPVSQSPAPSAPTAQAQPQPSRPTPPAPAATGSTQPKAPVAQPKPSLSQRLQEGAKSIGELPNDAAPGAGVQINLKAD